MSCETHKRLRRLRHITLTKSLSKQLLEQISLGSRWIGATRSSHPTGTTL